MRLLAFALGNSMSPFAFGILLPGDGLFHPPFKVGDPT